MKEGMRRWVRRKRGVCMKTTFLEYSSSSVLPPWKKHPQSHQNIWFSLFPLLLCLFCSSWLRSAANFRSSLFQLIFLFLLFPVRLPPPLSSRHICLYLFSYPQSFPFPSSTWISALLLLCRTFFSILPLFHPPPSFLVSLPIYAYFFPPCFMSISLSHSACIHSPVAHFRLALWFHLKVFIFGCSWYRV